MKLMEKLFGTHSERELKLINKTIDKIESLRPELQKLSDEEIKNLHNSAAVLKDIIKSAGL